MDSLKKSMLLNSKTRTKHCKVIGGYYLLSVEKNTLKRTSAKKNPIQIGSERYFWI